MRDQYVVPREPREIVLDLDRGWTADELAALDLAEPRPALRRECSWCSSEIASGQEPTSHGMCATCQTALNAVDDHPRPRVHPWLDAVLLNAGAIALMFGAAALAWLLHRAGVL